MALLYNTIRSFLLVSVATILLLLANHNLVDMFFGIYLVNMGFVGIAGILLIVKNNDPDKATNSPNTPYYAKNRKNYRESVSMRKEASKIKNDSSPNDGITENGNGSQASAQYFISLHDILLPPQIVSIIRCIISMGKR